MTKEELNELAAKVSDINDEFYLFAGKSVDMSVDLKNKMFWVFQQFEALTEYRDSMGFDVLKAIANDEDIVDKYGNVYSPKPFPGEHRYIRASDGSVLSCYDLAANGPWQPYTPPIKDMLEDGETYSVERNQQKGYAMWLNLCWWVFGECFDADEFEVHTRNGKPIKITTD